MKLFLFSYSCYYSNRKAREEVIKPRLLVDATLNMHMSGTSIMIIIFLLLALMGISQRILYDIARYVTELDKVDYFNNLQVIATHALVIIPLLIISIIAMVGLGKKREKYAVVLMPYFFTSILLALQLLAQITVYFYNNHTKLQYYIVVPLIIGITTAAIYYIQKLYQKKLAEMQIDTHH